MGKEQKYSEEKLLEAVVKYAGLHKRKIKTTELAAWASMNIDGLEGVKDYHFTRDVTETDPKTGEKTTRPKECKKKIDEINKSRHTASEMRTNPLLQASNVDAFLECPPHEQRMWILETRKQVEKVMAENRELQKKESTESARNNAVAEQLVQLDNRLAQLKEKQEDLLRAVKNAMDKLDVDARKAVLASIGITDRNIDLDTYANSLTIEVGDVFDMNRVIRCHGARMNQIDQEIEKMMEGIVFE